LLLQMRR